MKYIAYFLLPALVVLAFFIFRDKGETEILNPVIERTSEYKRVPLLDPSFDPRRECPQGNCKGYSID